MGLDAPEDGDFILCTNPLVEPVHYVIEGRF
jgi:hypothetical protein